MKETFYFPHDNNAHADPKCSALISEFGLAGYGLFWAIIEILHEQNGYLKKFPKLYDGLSFQLRIPKEDLTKLIEAMLHEYNLLQEDASSIWSDRVIRNLEERKQKYAAKAEAGRLGGLHSGISRNKTKQNEAVLEANELKESKGKESKGKEKKENNDIVAASDESADDVKQIMDIFYRINPTLQWGNKTQRSACSEMVSKFGLEKTLKLTEYAVSIQGQPFSPTITTPYQLKEKAAALIAYYQKNNSSNLVAEI